MSLDFSGYDHERPDQGGLPKKGKCHLLIIDIDADESHESYISVEHEIIAHEDPKEVGKSTYNSFQTSGKGAKRLQNFLEVTGILTREDICAAAAAGNTTIDPDYSKGEGKTYLGTLVESEYEGKAKCKVEFDFKSVTDPAGANYPRNTDYAAPIAVDEKETVPPDAGENDDVPF